VLVVRAESEAAVRDRLARDPWNEHGILALESVRRWEVFIDLWAETAERRRQRVFARSLCRLEGY
jgi:hypothetical protein